MINAMMNYPLTALFCELLKIFQSVLIQIIKKTFIVHHFFEVDSKIPIIKMVMLEDMSKYLNIFSFVILKELKDLLAEVGDYIQLHGSHSSINLLSQNYSQFPYSSLLSLPLDDMLENSRKFNIFDMPASHLTWQNRPRHRVVL